MRWIAPALVVSLAALLLSCGGGTAVRPRWTAQLPEGLPVRGELLVRPEPGDEPPLELRLPWANPRASFGFGAVHLWARPASDHVRVSAIIDAPADRARWSACETVTVGDGPRARALRARYVGRALEGGGSYEAVQVRFGIHDLRALAASPHAEVCGDRLELSAAQVRTVRRFVEWFDHFATPRRWADDPYFRDVGPRPALPGEDDDPGPLEG
ncbi:MAG TPA: hypothetical protein RMH99_05750 [Sandaracinaceae bacterium LLY-WYZ-13_1]|nr:hypothetical protein [Sandaracinaceae bacterium LLY-WYZ-13_1]